MPTPSLAFSWSCREAGDLGLWPYETVRLALKPDAGLAQATTPRSRSRADMPRSGSTGFAALGVRLWPARDR